MAWAKTRENILLSSSKYYRKCSQQIPSAFQVFIFHKIRRTIMHLTYAPLNPQNSPITIDSPMQNPKSKIKIRRNNTQLHSNYDIKMPKRRVRIQYFTAETVLPTEELDEETENPWNPLWRGINPEDFNPLRPWIWSLGSPKMAVFVAPNDAVMFYTIPEREEQIHNN